MHASLLSPAGQRVRSLHTLLVFVGPRARALPAQAVYGVLKEAEHRSTFYIPYWNIPITKYIVPRQARRDEVAGGGPNGRAAPHAAHAAAASQQAQRTTSAECASAGPTGTEPL